MNAQNIPPGFQLMYPVMFVVFISLLNATKPEALIIRALSQRHLVHLGAISYGIYMIHMLLWRAEGVIFRYIFGAEVEEKPNGELALFLDKSVEELTLIHVVSLIVLVVLANVSFRFLELPAKRLLVNDKPKN